MKGKCIELVDRAVVLNVPGNLGIMGKSLEHPLLSPLCQGEGLGFSFLSFSG